MRYLGKIVGHGLLKRADAADEPIAYDLDMFVRPGSGRTASGEITASADTLRKAFDQRRFRVQVEDGTYFDLFFRREHARGWKRCRACRVARHSGHRAARGPDIK